ncbi:MAG: helix-turn-helix transcriptional regulator, partial [Finegoldia magna]|nr:helix-turn-helix transcriptional regulator [Finegoldia magna]
MEIGDKIRSLRLKLGLTQEELAERSDLTKGFISQLERDLTSPSVDSLNYVLNA